MCACKLRKNKQTNRLTFRSLLSIYSYVWVVHTRFPFQKHIDEKKNETTRFAIKSHSICSFAAYLLNTKSNTTDTVCCARYFLVFWFCALNMFILHIFQVWISVHRKEKEVSRKLYTHITHSSTHAHACTAHAYCAALNTYK